MSNLAQQQNLDRLLERLESCFDEPLLNAELGQENHITLEVNVRQFTSGITAIHRDPALESRYLTLFAVDEGTHFSLHAMLLLKCQRLMLTVHTALERENPTYPALSPQIPAADWHEREIHDLFGIVPQGGNLQPLVLHRDWPRGGHYPMRRDFTGQAIPPIREVPHQFDMPQGAGRHQVAVGPIHAGIIEPGHMRFSVTGEQIHRFEAQLFYTHKGLEKMAEGKPYEQVLTLAEHTCGMCAFAHSLAFTQAIETLADEEIPIRAAVLRAILLEMERLASHFADLSAICAAGGFAFGSVRAAGLRELTLRLNQRLSGHRFLRGINTVGGFKTEIPDQALAFAMQQLTALNEEFGEWRDLVLNTDSFLDRVETTGFLSQQTARQLGLVGPAARGSGIDDDTRCDFPYGAHAYLPITAQICEQGDVFARMNVRIAEVSASITQIKRLVSALPDGSSLSRFRGGLPPRQSAAGLVESAKGNLLHWVMTGPNQDIDRWHVRSASYMNWRGMAQATLQASRGNNIVPDSPLVNKSFNLCYACVDR